MKKIIVTQRLPYPIKDAFAGYNLVYNDEDKQMDSKFLLKEVVDADGIISMLSDKIDRDLIDTGENLKIIVNYAVGYNNIDVNYAKQKGILVCNTPHILTETTAELAFALMIAAARRIVEADRFTRERRFTGWTPNLFLGQDLYKKRVGIYGFGRIGQAFARCCKGFEMDIVYYSRNRKFEGEVLTGAKWVTFDELVSTSDYIVVLAPLNESTKYAFTLETFKRMKPSAIFVNAGRGPIVKESDLVYALRNNIIRGAGLDVYEYEPVIDEGLFDLDNVVLLPHIGSASEDTRYNMADLCVKSIKEYLEEGKIPWNKV
ncbi:MAG: D-glycerate dehydrogenase [Calditerrivibrio sp.]|nr:D-glycerate dehydrogenase [Calditerrivibrio sp.]